MWLRERPAFELESGERRRASIRSANCSAFRPEGEGFVQARGGPVIRLRPGDIVITKPNEWHWHGAISERFMVHLAFTEGDTEWGHHLTDAEYPPPDA